MYEQLSVLKRWMILLTVSLSTFMATLDGSIVNIALPVISYSLRIDLSSVQWVVTAYLITISVLLLVWGKISDIHGKKYIFAFGFFMFTVGSAMCGFSQTLGFLIASRVVQAVGASAMMALSQGITTSVFPPEERGKALGIVGTTVAVGSLVGPSLGGVLVHLASWRSIFFINIPVGVLAVALTFVIIPNTFERLEDKSFDLAGTLLFSASLLLLFVGLLLVQQGTLPAAYFWPMLFLSAVCLAGFVSVERRVKSPLLQLPLFKKREFTFGLVSAYFSFIAMNSTLLFMPFYLQDYLHFSALKSGLVISAYPISTMVVAPLSGWLSDKISYRPLTVAGMCVATAALLFSETLGTGSGIPKIVFCLVLLGIGVAMFQSPNNSSIMGSVPKQQLGVAGGINALFRNLGFVSGTTFSVLIFTLSTKMDFNALAKGGSGGAGWLFMKGFRIVLLFDVACCLCAAMLNITRAVFFRPRKRPEAGK